MPAWMTQGSHSAMQPQGPIGSLYGSHGPQSTLPRPMSNGLAHQQQYGTHLASMGQGSAATQAGAPRPMTGSAYPLPPTQQQMHLSSPAQPKQQQSRPQQQQQQQQQAQPPYMMPPVQQQQLQLQQQQQLQTQPQQPARSAPPLFGGVQQAPQQLQIPQAHQQQRPPSMLGLDRLQGQQQAGIPPTAGALQQTQPQQQQHHQVAQPNSGVKAPDWTQHKAPDGRPYWYNAKTKVSTYTKPPEFGAPEQPKAALPATDWKEHTAPDGRKYYYNRVTKQSKWVPPEEWKRAQPGAIAASSAATSASAAAQPVVQKVAVPPTAVTAATVNSVAEVSPVAEVKAQPSPQLSTSTSKHMYATKDDAKMAFKQLLASVNMASDWSWEQTMRQIVSDSRYGALKSLGEKKACFNEYAQHRKNEEKDEARAKVKRQREQFTAMLEGHSATGDEPSKGPLRFSTARSLFEDDPRWKAVSNVDREELYQDYIREEEKREREAKQADRKRRAANFRDLLLSTTSIKVDTSWRKASGRLEGDPAFEAITRIDRLNVYQEYIKDLSVKEAADAEKKNQERRRGERHNRDAFTAMLKEHLLDGRLTAKTRFKEYLAEIKNEEAYEAVVKNQSGSRPRELFEDVIEDAETVYASDRNTLKEALKAAPIDIAEDTSFQDFCAAVDEGDSRASKIGLPNRRLFYQELVDRAAEKTAKEKKRAAKAAESFTDLLRSSRAIKAGMPWEEARGELASHRDYLSVSEGDRVALYEGHQAYLADRAVRESEKEAARAAKRRKDDADEAELDRKDGKRHKKSRHRDSSSDRKDKKHKSRKRDSPIQDKKSKSHKSDKRDRSEDDKGFAEEADGGSEPGEL